ncbi:unnamed protein product [Peniophora sp. CBMAI 1063]|nr:unnamed protein product [Peniophora sp. CBMAI 1063]
MSSEPAPESTLPYPPLYEGKKFVALSDWDGTITNLDSNDYLTDNYGFGFDERRKISEKILHGEVTFRDGFFEEMVSVSKKGITYEQAKQILRENISLDPGFKDFYQFSQANDIPVIIVSSGMEPTIRAVLSNLLGEHEKDIHVISNDVDLHPDGTWSVKYRHPSSGFGHDKSQAILPYRRLANPPFTFFFGDGVSDLSAARHADMLFVKEKPGGENDLHRFCVKEGIKHVLFHDFKAALTAVESIVKGEKTAEDWFAIGRV